MQAKMKNINDLYFFKSFMFSGFATTTLPTVPTVCCTYARNVVQTTSRDGKEMDTKGSFQEAFKGLFTLCGLKDLRQ